MRTLTPFRNGPQDPRRLEDKVFVYHFVRTNGLSRYFSVLCGISPFISSSFRSLFEFAQSGLFYRLHLTKRDAKPFLELPLRGTTSQKPEVLVDGARRRFDALRNLMRYVNELSMYPVSTSLLPSWSLMHSSSETWVFHSYLFTLYSFFLFFSFTVVLLPDRMVCFFFVSFSRSLSLSSPFSPSDGSEYPKIRDERPFCNWLFSSSFWRDVGAWCMVRGILVRFLANGMCKSKTTNHSSLHPWCMRSLDDLRIINQHEFFVVF